MRQVYTSARNENVDRVVALLRDAGIETSVTNRSNYAGHDFKGPSYTAKTNRETWAQVWVVHSADQLRARAILREIGIEPPTRYAEDVEQSRRKESTPSERRARFVWNARTIVLAIIAVLLLLNWLGIFRLF